MCFCLQRNLRFLTRVSIDSSFATTKTPHLKIHKYFILFVLLNLLKLIRAFWLSPDYWITIYGNQQVEVGRGKHELITFPQVANAYIGYWIDHNQLHHEAYGHVFAYYNKGKQSKNGKHFCGQFADAWANQSRSICGRFRLLARKYGMSSTKHPFEFVPISIANPLLAVEYLDTQISMIRLDSSQWFYGGARLAERLAFVAHPSNGSLIEISYAKMPRDYVERVRILQRTPSFPAEDLLNDSRTEPLPQLPPIPAKDKQLDLKTTTTSSISGNNLVDEERQINTTATKITTITLASANTQIDVDKTATIQEDGRRQQTTLGMIRPDEMVSKIDEQMLVTTTTSQSAYAEEYEELTGAGVQWGTLEVEVMQQGKKPVSKQRQAGLLLPQIHELRHRRHRYRFKHKHPDSR